MQTFTESFFILAGFFFFQSFYCKISLSLQISKTFKRFFSLLITNKKLLSNTNQIKKKLTQSFVVLTIKFLFLKNVIYDILDDNQL